jgi:hypothetical protein
MFRQNLKNALFRPKKLGIEKDDRIIDSGIIAICIIFLQNLIAVNKPDANQIQALIAFSIAIPMLAIHFLIIQTNDQPDLLVPRFLYKIFKSLFTIGFLSTWSGIALELGRVSWAAPWIFLVSCFLGVMVYIRIKFNKNIDIIIAKKEAEKQKPH